MKPVKGLEVVGPLPAELQLTTHLSAVVARGAAAPDVLVARVTHVAQRLPLRAVVPLDADAQPLLLAVLARPVRGDRDADADAEAEEVA